IIFSSTIPIKYDILDQLYELTNDNVVVAMRYGNGIKSLFNYPSQKTDDKHWYCVSQQTRPDQIFDIALYRKASVKEGAANV
ncbi:SAM-dependent methyltransferase, partial [Staphylococcus capitis]